MAIFTVQLSTSVRMFICLPVFVSETRSMFISFIYRSVPSEQELDAAQYSLTSIRNDMRARKEEAARKEGTTVWVLFAFPLQFGNINTVSGRSDVMVLQSRILISRR